MTHPDQAAMDQAKIARAVLDLAGLDVHVPGRIRTQGPAQVSVGPTVRSGWQVSIDLDAFVRLVAPLLRAAIDHPEIAAEHEYREIAAEHEYRAGD